jgi:RNA polymerase sigma-70 factor (ECF subfamily)
MATIPIVQRATLEAWTDEQVVEKVLAGDTGAFEVIMRRYNQRLYRVVMSILRNDAEAEDVMQDAYVRAYEHLSQFEGRAKFSTWLTRIAVHEALARARRGRRMDALEDLSGEYGELNMPSSVPDPEKQAAAAEMDRRLEDAVLALPDAYRAVLMLRDIEEMSTAEAADVLQITEENVKVRLHRARGQLRRQIYSQIGPTARRAFSFHAVRCDRVVQAVFARIGDRSGSSASVFRASLSG